MYTKPHEGLILLLGYRTTHLRDEVEKFMFALVNECHGCTEMSLSKSDSVTILVVEETLGSLGGMSDLAQWLRSKDNLCIWVGRGHEEIPSKATRLGFHPNFLA